MSRRSIDVEFMRSRGRDLEVKRSTAQELLCVMFMRSRDLEFSSSGDLEFYRVHEI